jgi:peptide/nickel transport system substrate-binding protein
MRGLLTAALTGLILAGVAHAQPVDAQTAPAPPSPGRSLRIMLREDADLLDPTLGRTYVGRVVFAALCDKLFDIDKNLAIVPQLATGYEWNDPTTLTIHLRSGVKFHDDTPLDAEAVKYSLMRHLNTPGSFRRSEVASMSAVEVVDPQTVRITLKHPDAAFLSQLTDRAGMIVSPKAAEAAGKDFGLHPVCTGPFRFVERIPQDRIVFERFGGYWNPDAIHFDRVTYLPVTDSSVRLANLQAGATDLVEYILPTDVATVKSNPKLRLVSAPSLAYQYIEFNVANGPRADTAIGKDVRVRRAFQFAIDPAALVQVVFNDVFQPTAQVEPKGSPFYIDGVDPPARDVAKAKALLTEAGVSLPVRVDLTVPNSPELRQASEVIQSMVQEAGFDLHINTMEFASSLQAAHSGYFNTYLIAWSGRSDPDGNIYRFLHTGGTENDSHFSNPDADALLDAAQRTTDVAARRDAYGKFWAIEQRDLPILYLWHAALTVGMTARLQGFVPVPDGIIRLQGMSMQ